MGGGCQAVLRAAPGLPLKGEAYALAKKKKPLGKAVVRYKLTNYRLVPDKPGEHKRRYKNIKTGQEISRREFAAKARREVVVVKPKEKLTVREKRVKWYANHYNHQIYDMATPDNYRLDEYISQADAEEMAEFQRYEAMIHSRDEAVREIGYEYFADLEDEYLHEDWGESPGAA